VDIQSNGGAGTQARRATARGVGNFCRVYFLDRPGRSPAHLAPAQPLIHMIHFVRPAVQRGDHADARTAGLDPESPQRPAPSAAAQRPAPTLPAAAVARRLPPSVPPGGSLPRPRPRPAAPIQEVTCSDPPQIPGQMGSCGFV
jgi:hypothetical protein